MKRQTTHIIVIDTCSCWSGLIARLSTSYYLHGKRAKHSDAVMTGILVTKFKMGQIGVEDLEQMAADESKWERCSAAKKVLDALRDGT